jgi:phage-related protein
VDFYLNSVRPVLKEWQLAASGFLPGIERGFNSARPAFGAIQNLIGSIAKAMGNMFADFGKGLASPAGQKAIATLTQILPQAISKIAPLLGGVGSLLIQVFTQLGPLMTALQPAMHALGGAFEALGHGIVTIITTMAPAIAPFFNALAGGFATVAPAMGGLFKAMIQGLTPILPVLASLIAALDPFLQQLVTGLAPILPVLGKALIALIHALSPLLAPIAELAKALLPVLSAMIQVLYPIVNTLADAIGQLVLAVIPTLPAFTQMFQACAPLVAKLGKELLPILPPLAKLIIQLGNTFLPIAVVILPLFLKILDFLVAKIVGPVTSALTWMTGQLGKLSGVISDAVSWLGKLPSTIGNLAGSMFNAGKNLITNLWNGIKSVAGAAGDLAKSIVNAIISGLDNFLHLPLKIPKIDLGFTSVGGETLIPKIPLMAAGGWVNSAAYIAGEAGREYVLGNRMLSGQQPIDPNVTAAVMRNQQINVPMAPTAGLDKFNRKAGMIQNNTFNLFGQTDPNVTAHRVAARLAMGRY